MTTMTFTRAALSTGNFAALLTVLISLLLASASLPAIGATNATSATTKAGLTLSFYDIDASFVMIEVKDGTMTGVFDVAPHVKKAKSLCALLTSFAHSIEQEFDTWLEEYEVGKPGSLSFSIIDVKTRDEYNKAKDSVAIGEITFARQGYQKAVNVNRKPAAAAQACWQ